MSFEAITTQEEFDARIKSRLEREKAKTEEKYRGFLSPEQVEEKYKSHLSPEQVEEKYKSHLSPEQVAAKYEGYISREEAAKQTAKINALEKAQTRVKVALNEGLPYELAEKISGETEEDMIKDAQKMAGFVSKTVHYPPYNKAENNGTDDRKKALKEILKGING